MICSQATPEDLNQISFHCGHAGINDYFREKFLWDEDAVPYCFWADAEKTELVGIAALSCSGIVIHSGSHFHLTPAIEIKIFALDETYQHQVFPNSGEDQGHWSDYCLYYLIQLIYTIVETQCGANHIVLYSVPEAVTFYQRHGFDSFVELMEMPSNRFIEGCIPMYLNL